MRGRWFIAYVDLDRGEIEFEPHGRRPKLRRNAPIMDHACAVYDSGECGDPEYIVDKTEDWVDAMGVMNGDMTRDEFRKKWGK